MTFNKWLDQLLNRNAYIMQAHLPLANKEDQPFDIRAFLQKNPNEEWNIIEKGVRIGEKGRIISNLSAGASIFPFEDWFQTAHFPLKGFLKQEMEEILTLLPSILENSFSALFEIGVDIGISPNGSLWILDVNSKPGRKVIMTAYPHLCEKLYKAPILYAAKLADEKGGIEMKKLYPIEIISNSEHTVYLPTDFETNKNLKMIAFGAVSKEATIKNIKNQKI